MIYNGLIIALAVLGIYYLLDSFVWQFKNSDVKKWEKPLYACHICMTSIWGTFFYFALGFDLDVFTFITTIGISAAFNMIIYSFVDKLQA